MASYSDDFNRATLGADWTTVEGGFDISSNQIRQSTTAAPNFPALCRYETALDTVDQEAVIDFTFSVDSGRFTSPAINMPPSGKAGYFLLFRQSSSDGDLCEASSSGFSYLVTTTQGEAPPINLKLARSDGFIRAYKAGSSTPFIEYEIVGTALTGKHAGVAAHSSTVETRGDNWSAQDLGSAGIATPTLSTPTATAVTSNSISFSIPVTF